MTYGPPVPEPATAGVPTPTHEEWQRLAASVVNRGRPGDAPLDGPAAEAALRTALEGGLRVDPLYSRDDRPLGIPGQAPFTRGLGRRDPLRPWDVRQRHDDPDTARSRAAVLDDLENGGTSVWLHAGSDGVDARDLGEVLADVHLDLAPVVLSSYTDQVVAARALVEHVGDREAAGIHLGVDPLGAAFRLGTTPELDAVAQAVALTSGRGGWRALAVDTRVLHEAGATEVDALAAGVATGVAYLRRLERDGTDPAAAFGQVEWRVTATVDQFLTSAALRALRRVWARVGEACGVPAPARGALTHAVTGLRMTTREDPFVNVLRATVATVGAVVGSADAVTVLPFDTAAGLPEPFSRRLARNTQLVLADEAHLGRVADPGGGSWYLESLTDQVAGAVWARFQAIERAGGVVRALTSGLLHEWVDTATTARGLAVATRERPLVGTSVFPDSGSPSPARRRRAELSAGDRALPPRRDAEPFERLRDRARAAGERPTVVVRVAGDRREAGPRLTFVENLLAVGGIGPVERGSSVAVLVAGPSGHARHRVDAVAQLRAEGVTRVLVAGHRSELGDAADVVDGEVHDGIDVVAALDDLLDRLGVPAAGGVR
ncbi:MAG: methylmalonyl-CoA mutase family protein [Phycicoccus sp.]